MTTLLQVWACGIAAALVMAQVLVAQTVQTESGAISGVPGGGLVVYKGVPFAAPPVGDLRWRPPAPVAPWAGTRHADSFAPACMQEGVSMPGEAPPSISEDCLYLNIWAPRKNVRRRPLPAIVWIYGGGYRNGSAAMPLYWGDRLAHKGVIVITIAYRLGPLGFLALPELTQESPQHSSGNYGLMDQIAALAWLQRNIGAFGGDPKRVTIAGQSSGSISISILLAAPRAKGLFQRAIGESGGLFEPLQLAPSYLLANAERDGEKYVASLGVASLQELRRLPATSLLGGGTAGGVTHPVIEPDVLPQSPYEAFVSGQQNDVPLIIGSNAEEARALTNVTDTKAATFDADIERSFGQRPPFPVGSVYQGWGAGHFAELWYVFDHLHQAPWRWSPADVKLAARIQLRQIRRSERPRAAAVACVAAQLWRVNIAVPVASGSSCIRTRSGASSPKRLRRSHTRIRASGARSDPCWVDLDSSPSSFSAAAARAICRPCVSILRSVSCSS